MAIEDWSGGGLGRAWGRAAVLWLVVFVSAASYQGTWARPLFGSVLAILFGIPVTMLVLSGIWLRSRRSAEPGSEPE